MFGYSFRRQRSCEDLHEDEVVILNSELATHSLVSYMENCYVFALSFSFLDKVLKNI